MANKIMQTNEVPSSSRYYAKDLKLGSIVKTTNNTYWMVVGGVFIDGPYSNAWVTLNNGLISKNNNPDQAYIDGIILPSGSSITLTVE